jgi:hypothetical protein
VEGRRVLATRVSHFRKRETCPCSERLPFSQKHKKYLNRIFSPFPASPCAGMTHGHLCHGIWMKEEAENGELKLLQSYSKFLRRGFKSWWTWGTIGEVVLNIETVLDKARWNKTRRYVTSLIFRSMWDALLWARLPFQWNARHTYIMRISHTRKREMRIIGARLTLGPNTLKF